MAKRIWKNAFQGYINLIAFPAILFGAILMGQPYLMRYLMNSPVLQGDPLLYFIRIVGVGIFFASIILITGKRDPNNSREFIMWTAVFYLSLAVFFILGPILSIMNWFALLPALFFLTGSLFLFAFVSRNILVRD